MTEAEDVLIEQAKADPEAFGALYEQYVNKVYSYIYNRTGSVPDAEDLTGKVFFQALTHLRGYDSRGIPFSAWLLRIAHNVVANWHRDNSRRRTIRLDDAFQASDDPIDIVQREEEATVRKVVATLPRGRQHLVVLKYVEGLSNAEIGQVMGRSEGAVKALLHRTLISLRKELDIKKDGRL